VVLSKSSLFNLNRTKKEKRKTSSFSEKEKIIFNENAISRIK